MYDEALLLEKLEQIDEALAKIKRRFTNIDSPDDFLDSDFGRDMLDGIAMMNCCHIRWTCGPYKAYAAKLMADFLHEHQNECGVARERLSEYGALGGWGGFSRLS